MYSLETNNWGMSQRSNEALKREATISFGEEDETKCIFLDQYDQIDRNRKAKMK